MPRPLSTHERDCLTQGLEALDRHTEAPLRLLGHASSPHGEVFDLCEEFELGSGGRRFLVSVDRERRGALLIPVAALAGGGA